VLAGARPSDPEASAEEQKEVASSIATMSDEKTGQAGQTGQPGDEEVWMSYSDVAMMKGGHKAMMGPAVPVVDDVACENTEAHIFDTANSARTITTITTTTTNATSTTSSTTTTTTTTTTSILYEWFVDVLGGSWMCWAETMAEFWQTCGILSHWILT